VFGSEQGLTTAEKRLAGVLAEILFVLIQFSRKTFFSRRLLWH